MGFKIKALIAVLMISTFLLSGCEVYQTLYGTTENVVVPPSNESQEPAANVTEQPTEPEFQPEPQPEIIPVKSQEKPVVIVVQETDLVNLIPKAEDPDMDTLAFTFTSPVNDNGEWQTTYGDAGEYTVTVTVSDGQAATSRDVLIIVNKKEETPTIDGSRPIESALVIDETQSIDFTVTASDLNNDPLVYSWKFDGAEVAEGTDYTYQSDYESAGTHTVKVDVSDGSSAASRIWSVEVRNVNRKPVIEQVGDISARETDEVVITVLATDDDRDPITYAISDRRFTQSDNVFTWQTDYDSAGVYEVTVSASDGYDTTEQKVTISVENVNRPPVIVDVLQKP